MKIRFMMLVWLGLALSAVAVAQDLPTVSPHAEYTLSTGETFEDEVSEPLSAPVHGRFEARPDRLGEYDARYEWNVYRDSPNTQPILHRFDQDIEYDFTKSGTYFIRLQVTFTLGQDTIFWPEEGEEQMMTVTISESRLEFPNAFSPNGDGINDVFRAKDGYQSIVEFEAAIYNRWGNKLYQWDNLDGGWDGRYRGSVVKDGVYFLVVNARGADGIKYNIRRDVNVLTGTKDRQGYGGAE